ncbi:hypothetical protein [Flavobacterium oreochromis]|uniref:hypothetical protein n=1 Tax=Flavobacterium oreochromis TaxID=2906078 RepID=UPI00385BC224
MIDIEKCKSIHDKLTQQALEEIFSELSDDFVQLLNTGVVNFSLHQLKSGRKNDISARVLNNWINQGVINVQPDDKGKIRRFDKLESIWLNIVIEARKFGVPLEFLKQSRKELFDSPIRNFSLLKFHVLETILRMPKILLILEEGHVKILSYQVYIKLLCDKKLPTHISFSLKDFIKSEFEKENFSKDFYIDEPYENIEKLKLLYYLKTGEYKCIKLFINEVDVRYIDNSESLLENNELLKILFNWEFHNIEVELNDDVSVMIKS